jgi:hypothetical protein
MRYRLTIYIIETVNGAKQEVHKRTYSYRWYATLVSWIISTQHAGLVNAGILKYEINIKEVAV